MKKYKNFLNKDALGREVKDLSNTSWWGLDRKEIAWQPQINPDICTGCGICFISCGRRVFDWDINKEKPIVTMPYNCMVACQTCANLCPCGAIEFSDISNVKKMLIKAKVVKKAFEIIEPISKNDNIPEEETQIEPEI